MQQPQKDQGIFILRQTDFAKDVSGFIIDRQARGLSPATVERKAHEQAGSVDHVL